MDTTDFAANISEAQNNVDEGEDEDHCRQVNPDYLEARRGGEIGIGSVVAEGEIHGDEDDVNEALDRLDQDGRIH